MARSLPSSSILVALGLLMAAGCGSDDDPRPDDRSAKGPRPRHNVLLVTLDTTRADRIGCYGGPAGITPRIDALAANGTRFEHCSSPIPHTFPSHVTMMTGEYPNIHGVRINGLHQLPEAATTLAEVLRDHGAATAAFPSAPVLEAVHGLRQGFDLYDDEIQQKEGVSHPMRPGTESARKFADWLDSLDEGEPFFAWVHFFEPHQPLDPPAALLARFPAYEAEIAEADLATGLLVDALAQRGLLDDTLVCVTADHGEGLGEHEEETHGVFLYQSVMWVPLVFSGPSIRNQVFDTRVSLVDITPTVLDLVGLEPFECGGVSLAPALRGEAAEPPDRPHYLETYVPHLSYAWNPIEAWISDGFKYVQTLKPELYDLSLDPHELNNLFESQPERARALREELERFRSELSRALEQDRQQTSEELLEQLARMGYALNPDENAGELPRPGDPAAGPDVKDRTKVLPLLHEMIIAGVLGDRDDTLRIGLAILDEEPDNPTALQHVGIEYCSRGDHEEAVRLLSRLEQSGRSTVTALLSLGVSLLNLDETEQAAHTLQRALDMDPSNPRILRWLGQAHEDLDNVEDALECYRRLLENREMPPAARQSIEAKLRALEH